MTEPAAAFVEGPLPARACHDTACRIVLDTLAKVTDTEGLIPELAFFEIDSRGRVWVNNFSRNGYFRFDPSEGDTVFVGGAGSGPGEFSRIGLPLMGPADSLHIFDMETYRLTVFTPELTVARTVRIPAPPAIRLPDGRFVVAGPIRTPEQIGWPLHLVSPDGTVEASFGVDEPSPDPSEEIFLRRATGPGSEGTIWVAYPAVDALERWDPTTQEQLVRWVHDPPWFEGAGPFAGDPRRSPLPPHIRGLWEDDNGVLWVLVLVPAADWAPLENVTTPWLEPEEEAAVIDRILVAHDPDTGEIVAELRIDRRVTTFPPHPVLVHGVEHAALDSLVWHLSRPRLEPAPP